MRVRLKKEKETAREREICKGHSIMLAERDKRGQMTDGGGRKTGANGNR